MASDDTLVKSEDSFCQAPVAAVAYHMLTDLVITAVSSCSIQNIPTPRL